MSDPSPIRTIPNDYSHYTPLSSGSKEIRLLRILSAASPEAPLMIALVRTKLATCPPYTALSYCWGSLDRTKTITLLQDSIEVDSTWGDDRIQELNDRLEREGDRRPDIIRDFKVTTNLHAALHSFRSRNITGFIWADMLCINQGDDYERSSQVGFMKSIFGAAESVNVWLGTEQKYADALFANENVELAIFAEVLELWDWGKDNYELGELFEMFWSNLRRASQHGSNETTVDTFSFPEFYDKECDLRWSARMTELSLHAFHRSLLKYESSIDRLLETIPGSEIPGIYEEELPDLVLDVTRLFLAWLYLPCTQMSSHEGGDENHGASSLIKYTTRIFDRRSEVWRFMAHDNFCRRYPYARLSMVRSILDRATTILKHPFFSRTWVLQEVSSNHRVKLVVGTQETKWRVLLNLLRFYRTTLHCAIVGLATGTERPQHVVDIGLGQSSDVWMALNGPNKDILFMDLLGWTEYFQTTDPRDKLFAIYHLATDLPNLSFRPDYTKTEDENWTSFTRAVIQATHSLRIVGHETQAHQRRSGLPSWVRNPLKSLADDFHFPKFHCSGNSKANLKVVPNESALVLQGFGIATVGIVVETKNMEKLWSQCGGNFSGDCLANFLKALVKSQEDDQEDWKPDEGDGSEKVPILILWYILNQVHILAFGKSSRSVTSVEDVSETKFSFESFAEAVSLSLIDSALPEIAMEWEKWCSDFERPMDDLLEWRYQQMRKPAKETDAVGHSDLIIYYTMIVSRLDYFFSHGGRIGLCPRGTRRRDVIVGLFGGNMPYVLRPKTPDPSILLTEQLRQGPKYRMIGTCYIDGEMQGEWMRHHS